MRYYRLGDWLLLSVAAGLAAIALSINTCDAAAYLAAYEEGECWIETYFTRRGIVLCNVCNVGGNIINFGCW
jgi:hypothetical protein